MRRSRRPIPARRRRRPPGGAAGCCLRTRGQTRCGGGGRHRGGRRGVERSGADALAGRVVELEIRRELLQLGGERAGCLRGLVALHRELRVLVEPRELLHRQVAKVPRPAALALAVEQREFGAAVGDDGLLAQVAREGGVSHLLVEGRGGAVGEEHAVLVPDDLLEDGRRPIRLNCPTAPAAAQHADRGADASSLAAGPPRR